MIQIIIPEEYLEDEELKMVYVLAAYWKILQNRDENDGKR